MSHRVGLRTRASLGDKVQSLELHLSRRVFARGRQLSGVVVLRLERPVDIKSLVVSIEGQESAASSKLPSSIRPVGSFYKRDALLSGKDRPRFIAERLSEYWNAFLKRERYRSLSAGEHTYPFTLPLPGSLPPSCEAKSGRVTYKVTARLSFPLGRALQASTDVPLTFSPRDSEQQAFSLSHSSVYGGKHATGADITVALPSRSFALGTPIEGSVILSNPRRLPMGPINISLGSFDGVRSSGRGGVEATAGSVDYIPEDSTAPQITTSFSLEVPSDAPPSVEGTALLVAWSINVTVTASPPIELQVPVIVRLPTAP